MITHIVAILFRFMEKQLCSDRERSHTKTILCSHKFLCCHGEDHPVHDILAHVHCINLFHPSLVCCVSILCCTNNGVTLYICIPIMHADYYTILTMLASECNYVLLMCGQGCVHGLLFTWLVEPDPFHHAS